MTINSINKSIQYIAQNYPETYYCAQIDLMDAEEENEFLRVILKSKDTDIKITIKFDSMGTYIKEDQVKIKR